MIEITCPCCDRRASEVDFTYLGEAHVVRPGPDASDEEWLDFLYIRRNTRGAHAERWRHFYGCGRIFNAVRDTVSDKVLATYEIGQPRPEILVSDKSE